eukprot:scaffold68122_cov49-Attheya_sp.AAC.4
MAKTYSTASHLWSTFPRNDGFRWHIVQSSHLVFTIDVYSVIILNRLCNTKIDEFERTANKEKIGWLQVTVNDSFFVY